MNHQQDANARLEKLQSKPWNAKGFTVPEQVFSVPGMLWTEEKRMLYYLALNDYLGEGVIADMGCFLGGSTICFATALRQRCFERAVINSFDLFKLGAYEREHYFPSNPPPELKTRAIFEGYLREYMHLIKVNAGDVLSFTGCGEPIELLFVDIAKSYPVMDHLVLRFFSELIPSRSLIVMQDYLSPQTGPWHHVVMQKLCDYCEYIFDLCGAGASAVFFVQKAIPHELLEQCQWTNIPLNEKLALMDQAIEKLNTEKKKNFLRENRRMLVDGRDRTWGMHYHAQ